jgi:iron(III) transport system substrate-binding protein
MKKPLVVIGAVAMALFTIAGEQSAPAASTPLYVYSAQGYDSDVSKAFTKATGIPVNLVDDSTGPLLAKIQAEKNNPRWGVLWVDGNTPFAALDKQGLLATYKSKASFNTLGKSLVPTDNSYIPTGTTVMAAMIYNADKVTNVPTSYQDLLKPQYKGMIGMNDPSQSGPTFPFIAGIFNQLGGQTNGVKAGEEFFKQLKGNGLQVFPTNGDTKHALETGLINIGLIQSSAAIGEVIKFTAKPQAGFNPKIVYLPKSTLLPSVIGIDDKVSATEQVEAKKFVDFVLSAAGQKAMQGGDASGDSLYWPVIGGINPLPQLPAAPAFQSIDPYFWGPQQGTIDDWFDTNIKG